MSFFFASVSPPQREVLNPFLRQRLASHQMRSQRTESGKKTCFNFWPTYYFSRLEFTLTVRKPGKINISFFFDSSKHPLFFFLFWLLPPPLFLQAGSRFFPRKLSTPNPALLPLFAVLSRKEWSNRTPPFQWPCRDPPQPSPYGSHKSYPSFRTSSDSPPSRLLPPSEDRTLPLPALGFLR